MGSGKKNHQRKIASSSFRSNGGPHHRLVGSIPTANSCDEVGDSPELTTFFVSWLTIGSLVSVLLMSILFSILLGVLVSIVLSVQYQQSIFTKPGIIQVRELVGRNEFRELYPSLDEPNRSMVNDSSMSRISPAVMMLLSADEFQVPGRRCTIVDAHIASFNRQLDGEKNSQFSISTVSTGRQAVLTVVDEADSHELKMPENDRKVVEKYDQLAKATVKQFLDSNILEEANNEHEKERMWWEPQKSPIRPPELRFDQWTDVYPSLCADGRTIGFDSWHNLENAIEEANDFTTTLMETWIRYYMLTEDSYYFTSFENAEHYYRQPITLQICPNATLKAPEGPIFINAANLRITCLGCSIDVGGKHFSFGPRATNVVLQGILFRNAEAGSLIFYYNNAHATFEDCRWIDNIVPPGKSAGAVVDINSTSLAVFKRCAVGRRVSGQTSASILIRPS